MGTNYYLMTRKYEYKDNLGFKCELIDDPYFGYRLHLMKNSCGWLCLFEQHPGVIECVADIKKLYDTGDFEIMDEYRRVLTWEEYSDIFKSKYALDDPKWAQSHLTAPDEGSVIKVNYFKDSEGYEFTDRVFC